MSNKQTLNILDTSQKHHSFDYAEIYRLIRTNIEFSGADQPIRSVALTSTKANEAKSTTSINLAYIFATKYPRVLLIDGDLRKMMLHRYLHISNPYGLTDALKDFRQYRQINDIYFQKISHPGFVEQLTVLTAGTRVPNPSELLGARLFRTFMQTLKNDFDFIIVDCAPIGAISDAIPIGHAVDGTIFIVSAKDTKRKEAAYCVQLLKQNRIHLLGSILTKAEEGNGHYYYYY